MPRFDYDRIGHLGDAIDAELDEAELAVGVEFIAHDFAREWDGDTFGHALELDARNRDRGATSDFGVERRVDVIVFAEGDLLLLEELAYSYRIRVCYAALAIEEYNDVLARGRASGSEQKG